VEARAIIVKIGRGFVSAIRALIDGMGMAANSFSEQKEKMAPKVKEYQKKARAYNRKLDDVFNDDLFDNDVKLDDIKIGDVGW
jgi:hypothetical protein